MKVNSVMSMLAAARHGLVACAALLGVLAAAFLATPAHSMVGGVAGLDGIVQLTSDAGPATGPIEQGLGSGCYNWPWRCLPPLETGPERILVPADLAGFRWKCNPKWHCPRPPVSSEPDGDQDPGDEQVAFFWGRRGLLP